MIEEIKKEIDAKTWWRDNKDGRFYNCCKVGDDRTPIIKINELFEILDKYNNQDRKDECLISGIPIVDIIAERDGFQEQVNELIKYKSAWEELYLNYGVVPMDNISLAFIMGKISKKYNLDNKQVSIVERVDE